MPKLSKREQQTKFPATVAYLMASVIRLLCGSRGGKIKFGEGR